MKVESELFTDNKHLFNEFGIILRKKSMFEKAVCYYERCAELDDSDENILFNLARAFYHLKNKDDAVKYVNKSLSINPNHENSIKLKKYLSKSNKIKDA